MSDYGFRPPTPPRMGALPQDAEQQFQMFMTFDPSVRQWRNAFANRFGEQPIIDGGNYDYRAAWQAGSRPQMVPGDTIPHWSSVGKAADHPTMWKQQFMDQFGTDPDELQGGQVTPEIQRFMQAQIGRGLF